MSHGASPPFPPVTRAARVYVGVDRPESSYHNGPLVSRFVLYDDHAFAMQYASPKWGNFEYLGTYDETNDRVTFYWQGSNRAGPWDAVAVITEESLAVKFSFLNQLNDFYDGLYLRAR